MKTLLLATACALIIVVAGISSVASARTTEAPSINQGMRGRIGNDGWEPGLYIGILKILFYAFMSVLLYLRLMIFGIPP